MRPLRYTALPQATITSASTGTLPQPATIGALNARHKVGEIGGRMLVLSKVRWHALRYLFGCLFAIAFLAGCAQFSSRQLETAADGTQRQTHIVVWTLFDAHSDLTKLRASTTEKTQGLSLAGLDQSATSTNLVRILELVAALAAATAK